jgi:hypothetical protein
MTTEEILAFLITERDKLNTAIQALQGKGGGISGGGVKPKTAGTPTRKFSAAARKRMALAQKKRWAAIKAKKA